MTLTVVEYFQLLHCIDTHRPESAKILWHFPRLDWDTIWNYKSIGKGHMIRDWVAARLTVQPAGLYSHITPEPDSDDDFSTQSENRDIVRGGLVEVIASLSALWPFSIAQLQLWFNLTLYVSNIFIFASTEKERADRERGKMSKFWTKLQVTSSECVA